MFAVERADGDYALQGKWGSSCLSYTAKSINSASHYFPCSDHSRSWSCQKIISLLACLLFNLSNSGKTVITTIHNPCPALWMGWLRENRVSQAVVWKWFVGQNCGWVHFKWKNENRDKQKTFKLGVIKQGSHAETLVRETCYNIEENQPHKAHDAA